MIRHHHGRPVRTDGTRWSGMRGAAMVELAFIALLLTTLSAGAFDYGLAWRASLATNEAARTAARTGSALADTVQADWYALSGAKAALTSAGQINNVEKVVIYKSTTVTGEVPSQCKTATTSTQPCVVLTGAQFRSLALSDFSTTTGCFNAATIKNWCPTSRNNVQMTSDYYGVWIQLEYTHLFKFLQSSTTIERDAVMRLEPDAT